MDPVSSCWHRCSRNLSSVLACRTCCVVCETHELWTLNRSVVFLSLTLYVEIFQRYDGIVQSPAVLFGTLPESQDGLTSFFPLAWKLLVVQGLIFVQASRLYSDTPRSVGLFWPKDRSDAEISVWQHITLTRDRHPCPQRDSNRQSRQASGHRPTS